MSRTKRNYKGEEYPDKTRKNRKEKKFMGFREGHNHLSDHPNPKKGVDFINYGWPLELRAKSVIKQKIQDDMYLDILNEELNS
jgi:hypothetical protein